jgi:argininosuccinate lyase
MWIANELGFSRPSNNSIDAVSDRDFVSEYLFICASIGVHLSRIAEEIILFTTSEFGYAKLSDEFSTGSSIMPQKKNPDAAELTRGKAGRLIGNLTNILVTSKALPFAYNRDLQEDKEPVFDSHDNLLLMLKAITGSIRTIEFDIEKLRKQSVQNHALATEVADYLVKKGMAFSQAHEITGQCVKLAENKNKNIHELDLIDFKSVNKLFEADLMNYLDVDYALGSRINAMGTSPSNVEKQIQSIKQELLVLSKWSKHNPHPGLKI